MQNRITWIDSARGIGIVLVVYGHVLRGLHASSVGVQEPWFTVSDTVLYSFHMPLFFFLAGLVVEASISKYGRLPFALGRTKALAYPYLLWSIVQGTVSILLAGYVNKASGDINIHRLVLLAIQPIAQFWFLLALLYFSWLYAVIWRRLPGIAILALGTIAYAMAAEFSAPLPHALAQNFVFFAAGAVAGVDSIDAALRRVKRMWPIVAVVFAVGAYMGAVWFAKSILLSLIMAAAGIALTLSIAITISQVPQLTLARVLGAASMAIYVLHVFGTAGTRIFLYFVCGVSSLTLHLIGGIVLGILGPMAIWWTANRYGLTEILGLGRQLPIKTASAIGDSANSPRRAM
jgi:fucose 4-O-acetylase-like acetyltransferase